MLGASDDDCSLLNGEPVEIEMAVTINVTLR